MSYEQEESSPELQPQVWQLTSKECSEGPTLFPVLSSVELFLDNSTSCRFQDQSSETAINLSKIAQPPWDLEGRLLGGACCSALVCWKNEPPRKESTSWKTRENCNLLSGCCGNQRHATVCYYGWMNTHYSEKPLSRIELGLFPEETEISEIGCEPSL